MHFILHAKDGTDSGASERRMAARVAHLDHIKQSLANIYIGAAILNDDGHMIGSMLVVDFPSRADLDAWLAQEPYVLGNVWQDIEITPCAVAPSFLKNGAK